MLRGLLDAQREGGCHVLFPPGEPNVHDELAPTARCARATIRTPRWNCAFTRCRLPTPGSHVTLHACAIAHAQCHAHPHMAPSTPPTLRPLLAGDRACMIAHVRHRHAGKDTLPAPQSGTCCGGVFDGACARSRTRFVGTWNRRRSLAPGAHAVAGRSECSIAPGVRHYIMSPGGAHMQAR